jgi:ABC-type uncharacterized transport system substrate-binding protein
MVRTWRLLLVALGLGCALVASAAVHAHPHGWIDIQTRLVLDDQRRVVLVEQAWLFDDLYSAFVLEEFAQAGQSVDEGLRELGQADIVALAEFDYFTVVEADGERQSLGRVERFANGVTADRVWLKFELPLAEPLPLEGRAVRYAVFDPTYYIEILHGGAPPVVFGGPATDGCNAEVIPPEPPSEAIWLAAALDRDETAGDGLGIHFAEWVNVRCD